MVIHANVRNYIVTEFASERIELDRRVAFPICLLSSKIAEFYRAVKRLFGLAHVQYGPRTGLAIRTNARKNLHLFPAASPASHRTFAPAGHRILIDVTDTLCFGTTTGIQRVVRQLAKVAVEDGLGIPVFIQDERLFSYLESSSKPVEIEIGAGDKFIMADISWNDIARYRAVMQRVSRTGGTNILILHDIIPLTYPELFPVDFYPCAIRNHLDWFNEIVVKADAVVAVSKSAAEDFLGYLAVTDRTVNPNLRVGWNHLGADFAVAPDERLSNQVSAICSKTTPFLLSVGTIEPRKAVRIAIEAMDRLWASGADIRYVIAGHNGYCSQAVLRSITTHPEYGRRLFWVDYVSSVDLRALYQHAHSLIFASIVEGFGLPLVEAAHLGLPVIASDIPVFRELGSDALMYFDVADSEHLAARIDEALARPRTMASPPVSTWHSSMKALLKLIGDESYQFGLAARPHLRAGA